MSEVTYQDFLDVMESLTPLQNDFIPPRFYSLLNGDYKLDDNDEWWFRAGPAPFWWNFSTAKEWGKAYDTWSETAPWVKSNGPFPKTDEEVEANIKAGVEILRNSGLYKETTA